MTTATPSTRSTSVDSRFAVKTGQQDAYDVQIDRPLQLGDAKSIKANLQRQFDGLDP
jgi:hypothetical protein